MEQHLTSLVTGDQVLTWIVIAFLVGFFVYKEWPGFKGRVSGEELKDLTVKDQLEDIGKRLDRIESALDRDYTRINALETEIDAMQSEQDRMKDDVSDSLQEREIIMRALSSALSALQELGANGPTGVKESQAEISEYLNGKAHKPS